MNIINFSIYPQSFIDAHCENELQKLLLPRPTDVLKQETEECGVGIYALRPFARGECIGSFIAEPTHKIMQHTLQRAPDDHLHDPYFVGFFLHSCNPNVVVDMHQQRVFCIRDIAKDEPLCMDYASTEDTLFRQFSCACNAPNCRQWISGRNELVNDEGLRYIQHLKRTALDRLYYEDSSSELYDMELSQ